jgi:MoaA/NifB/PqqE/SkfB family radical SAM enzyme/SAM-dependent methyltransferase
MSFDPGVWSRLEYGETPIWVQPDKPDWFVPNRAGDLLLRAIVADRRKALDLAERRFLDRLPGGGPRDHSGRHAHLTTDRLRELWFHLLNRCNMACEHCLVSSSPGASGSLTARRILEIAGQAVDLGCTVFALTGGEPFVHDEFEAIVDGLLAFEGRHVVVLTNGTLLREHADALDRWPPDRFHLQVSIDGMGPGHDAIRGEHAFERLRDQLSWLGSRGFPFTASMCVMRDNCAQMPGVVDFAAEVGASNVHFLWYFVHGRATKGEFAQPEIVFEHLKEAVLRAAGHGISIDNVEACRSSVFSPAGTIHDGTNSGWESLAVGPGENLYPSPALVADPALGTPLGSDLATTWRASAILEELRRSSSAHLSSPLRYIVSGDPDHSFLHGGRYVGHDPHLPLYEKMALWLIAAEADAQSSDGPPGLRLKMGDVLERCGAGGEVALAHSNCLLAIASKNDVRIVEEYYSEAARSPREEILNPVHYPDELVAHIPRECLVRTYGCGSPVTDAEIRPGETVVDLGSGTGVECLIAAKLVGRQGSVIGIDMLDPMLALARRGAAAIGERLGYANVRFEKAYLESLPLADGTADLVLSNCVINLSRHKRRTFAEIFRVLREGGRLVVSDVVCEEEPSGKIRNDETLYGECVAGALTQRDLVGLLDEAGFSSFLVRNRFPYRVVAGHPFFSMTFVARKPAGKRTARLIYRGPLAAALMRDGTLLPAGTTQVAEIGEGFDGSDQIFEIGASGEVLNAEAGSSICSCAELPPEEAAAGVTAACRDAGSRESRLAGPAPAKLPRGCMVCGEPINYSTEEHHVHCEYCQADLVSAAVCAAGHFVCDACHADDGLSLIERICGTTRETDMIALLRQIRAHGAIPLHGPEHHALVPGIILATYRNIDGRIPEDTIRAGIRRGATVPGGACGFMGSCGAAMGVGIAFALILESTPLTPVARGRVQAATSKVLAEIAGMEAARCCQRECYVALRKAAELSRDLLPTTLRAEATLECEQADANEECIGTDCPLFDPVASAP